MIFLTTFSFPDGEREFDFQLKIKRQCYDSFYPFGILSKQNLKKLHFEPITILYGGNGSGKSTALNIIAEKLELKRDAVYNKSNFYNDYISMCDKETASPISESSRIITSDDVFDYMLNIRCLNQGIDQRRDTLFDEYLEAKHARFKMKSINDYERLKTINKARSKTQSRFVRENVMDNVPEFSNGETAYRYFTDKLEESGLYLLDEPENSLSPKRQIELMRYIADSARFFGCQFIIATHSPFLLSLPGSKIYNLDDDSTVVENWADLENVRIFYDFFKEHENNFL